MRNAVSIAAAKGELPVLRIEHICVRYGQVTGVHDASLWVEKGEVVTLLGVNGAGKSTVLLAAAGILPVHSGRILYRADAGEGFGGRQAVSGGVHSFARNAAGGGKAESLAGAAAGCGSFTLADGYADITRENAQARHRRGIALVPEGRRVFSLCTVKENLLIGAHTRRDGVREDLERMYGMFPVLYEKRRAQALSLSGGQQQMLAIARALMGRPRLLLLDEPTMGLSPALCAEVYGFIKKGRNEGLTVVVSGEGGRGLAQVSDRAVRIVNGVLQ